MTGRYANLARIRRLDPERDYVAIYRMMMELEFPWDMLVVAQLAFFRSFAMPSIAAVLAETGKALKQPEKRLTDTATLMYEILTYGFGHPRAQQSLNTINKIHSYHTISNDEYLYVLGCLLVIPMRWLHAYGWRRPCCHERQASYLYYRELGRRMNIADIPASFTEFETWFDNYEKRHLHSTRETIAIERANRKVVLDKIPTALGPIANQLISALYGERMRNAVGHSRPHWTVQTGLHLSLTARAEFQRLFGTSRTQPLFANGGKMYLKNINPTQ